MSANGFAVLCSADGVVVSTYGEAPIAAGTALAAVVARESRERLLQILSDARRSEQHSIIQVGGATLEVHCAGDGERILVVAGASAADVRWR
ncbi:MAG TPA: hypothetical protein VF701_16935, partial [Thermoanaerobaculia bacterium]